MQLSHSRHPAGNPAPICHACSRHPAATAPALLRKLGRHDCRTRRPLLRRLCQNRSRLYVVDFTHYTDAALLAYLARASHACGRFRADQLGRPLLPPAAPSRWRSWLASVLALGGVLGSSRAAAQGGGNFHPGPVPATVRPAATPIPPKARPATSPEPAGAGELLVVRGTVADSASGERLPGVTVQLKGTSRGTSTNQSGEFVLEIPDATLTTLLVSYVGYMPQQIPVANAAEAAPISIKISANTHVVGNEVAVYAGGISLCSTRQPWHWRPRALYYRAKYLLLRPFQ